VGDQSESQAEPFHRERLDLDAVELRLAEFLERLPVDLLRGSRVTGVLLLEDVDLSFTETTIFIEKVKGDEVSGVVRVGGSWVEWPGQKDWPPSAVCPTCLASKLLWLIAIRVGRPSVGYRGCSCSDCGRLSTGTGQPHAAVSPPVTRSAAIASAMRVRNLWFMIHNGRR
jgi:hypothetical protein